MSATLLANGDIVPKTSMRRGLLLCGLASAILYVATDLLGAMSWQGYDYSSQAISELTAIGAPTRPLLVPLYLAYDLLVIAFGLGVWHSAGAAGRLRYSALCLLGIGLVGLAWPFFPMHLRGAEPTFSDTMHIALAGATVLLILLAVLFAAGPFGRGFRLYSVATLAVMIVFGGLAALDGPRLAAQLPTPWLGVTERINVGAYLLWTAMLSLALLRSGARARNARPNACRGSD